MLDALHVLEGQQKASAVTGSENYEGVVAQNHVLLNALTALVSYVKNLMEARPAREQGASNRMTSKNLFGKRGSATGPEGRAMIAAKAAEKQRKEEEARNKRETVREKRAKDVARDVTGLGSALLQRIAAEGAAVIRTFKVQELLALMQNADPQVVIRKLKKAEALEKVRELSTVQAAISRQSPQCPSCSGARTRFPDAARPSSVRQAFCRVCRII